MFDDIAENNQIVKGIRGGGKFEDVGPQKHSLESAGFKQFPGGLQSSGIQVDADNTASRFRERLQIPSFVTARFQHAACVSERFRQTGFQPRKVITGTCTGAFIEIASGIFMSFLHGFGNYAGRQCRRQSYMQI